ncbi:MAG: HD domain-containing protein [Spirochaetales bacterium]|nr:HD domain-containing protein [Spirochaetales bacterium]
MKLNRIGIKTKILLPVIPLLVSCFFISGALSLRMSRNNIITQSGGFIRYKLNLVSQYAAGQWSQLVINDMLQRDDYRKYAEESIRDFALQTITPSEEIILTIHEEENLVFCTDNVLGKEYDSLSQLKPTSYYNGQLYEYALGNQLFLGQEKYIEGLEWHIYYLQKKNLFTADIRRITINNIIIFTTAFIIIIVGIVLVLNFMINPINQVKTAIRKIMDERDFSHSVPVRSTDEVGDLTMNFNNMIASVDLAQKKLKSYAVKEAVSSKLVYQREIEALELLGRASDYKDVETGNHVKRVSAYSCLIAEAIGIADEYIELLSLSAPLHDIGKLGIPDNILLKKGKLSGEEKEIMQSHTTMGFEILSNCSSKYLKAGAVIAHTHHEKYDGTGYPRGLAGEEISLFGRIVSVADVFDALTTVRPYKQAWPVEKALELIESEKGRHFDPKMVDVFIQRRKEIENILQQQKDF